MLSLPNHLQGSPDLPDLLRGSPGATHEAQSLHAGPFGRLAAPESSYEQDQLLFPFKMSHFSEHVSREAARMN